MKCLLRASCALILLISTGFAAEVAATMPSPPKTLVNVTNRTLLDQKGSLRSIPHILHFINVDDRPLLDIENARIQSWQALHPSWQVKTWNKNNVQTLDLYTKDTLSKVASTALKAELIRFEVLYKFGGICTDMNIECLKSFDALVSNCDFFAASTYESSSELKTALIGAKPTHPVIRNTLDTLQSQCALSEAQKEPREFSVNTVLSTSFRESGNRGNKDLVLDSHYFYPVPEVDQQAMIPLDVLRVKYFKNDGQVIQLCHTVVDIVVVVASYNNGSNNHNACITNLESLRIQKWPYFSVIIIDDCSRDNNYELISNYVKTYHMEDKVKVIHNPVRRGALANNYTAILSVAPGKVVATQDGDDPLQGDNALTIVASAYADKRPWITYGSYAHDTSPKQRGGCAKPITEAQSTYRQFRKLPWMFSQLRTFYAKLFHKINIEDLKRNGDFYPITQDLAFMFPMLEMASRGHIRFIPNIIYIYNTQNPINDFKKDSRLQNIVDAEIRRKPMYEPIELW